MKTANPIAKIAKYTLLDEIRQRSFVVMFIVCVAFVFLARGCYRGNYVVNGEALDAATVVAAVSKAAFHVIAVVTMLIAALLSMRMFRRDRDGGMQSAILSKPITRRHYVLGKVMGLWVLSAVFMLILQAIVLLTVVISAGVVIPGYPVAALLCCLNLLFVVIAVLLLSLLMPETAAFLCIMGIAVVGLIIDGINALGGSQIAQAMAGPTQTALIRKDPLLRVAQAFRDAVFRFFLHRRWRFSGPLVGLSSFQHPVLLSYTLRVAALAFQKGRDSLAVAL